MTEKMIAGKTRKEWFAAEPLLVQIAQKKPVFWKNQQQKAFSRMKDRLPFSRADIEAAKDRFERFAPYFQRAFPEAKRSGGRIESELRPLKRLKQQCEIKGRWLLKMDGQLPIAGSIKARGGFYEVLKWAESLAWEHGLLTGNETYADFHSERFKNLFQNYEIAVGSTGNLGLSIGILGSALGFRVNVHMSRDARRWKKELLRQKGARVLEYEEDFTKAVAEGRKQAENNPRCYFVDDESSKDLFLGYSAAAFEVKKQLQEQGITIDSDHPLFVYLPCGVGGSPGGITFGLKHVFGDHVHCYFIEPVASPAVLLGLLTGLHNRISVFDFGLDNKTEADGLAVGRPSTFVTKVIAPLVSGIYTIEDEALFYWLARLQDEEEIRVEPSAASSLSGPLVMAKERKCWEEAYDSENIVHLSWATGGALIPDEEYAQFYQKGKRIASTFVE